MPWPALVASAALAAAACSDSASEVGTVSAALTAEQCEFFQVDGKIQICHKTGSTKKPYTILKVATEACIDGHAAHTGDYVAIDDPDCKGLGCFPVGAPVDGTVPCCEGLVEAGGHCACPEDTQCTTWSPNAEGTCSPTQLGAESACGDALVTTVDDRCDGAGGCSGQTCAGATCRAPAATCVSGAAGETVALDGLSFQVPFGSDPLTLCRTTDTPPTSSTDGASIDARSPVYEFLPGGPLAQPITIAWNVGGAEPLTLFWSEDGAEWQEPDDVAIAGGVMTMTTTHFSKAVASANNCPLASDLGKVCGSMPTGPSAGPCSTEPTCQPNGSKLKCKAAFEAAGTPCRDAADLCDAPETCSGNNKTCPADVIAAAGTECRPAASQCDVAETCDGLATSCPADLALPASTTCDDADPETSDDVCDGAGVCAGTAGVACVTQTRPQPGQRDFDIVSYNAFNNTIWCDVHSPAVSGCTTTPADPSDWSAAAYGKQDAIGTSNNVGWQVHDSGFIITSGFSSATNGWTGFDDTSNYGIAPTTKDALHGGGADMTIAFDDEVKDIVFYMKENFCGSWCAVTSSFDFSEIGGTLEYVSGAVTITGRKVAPGVAGGAVRLRDVNAKTITMTHGTFDGQTVGWYVEAINCR